MSIASASRIAALKAPTGSGSPFAMTSSLYGGMSPSRLKIDMAISAGATSTAARKSPLLKDPSLKLPGMPTTRMFMIPPNANVVFDGAPSMVKIGQASLVKIPFAALRFGKSEVLAHCVQMRMNLQRAAKTDRRLAELADRHMAETLPGSGAEVIGIARQSFLAVGDGIAEVLHHVAYGSAL